ncbi:MAG: SDR family oxidoreductase [Alphaproteobacteria bacterium]
MTKHTTLITGVSKGIGRALADRLIARGHTVIGLARTKPDAGYRGEFHAVDLMDEVATAKTLRAIVERHAVDHVVNNAAFIKIDRIEEATIADLDRTLALNLKAAMLCAQACLPAMKTKGRGRIVNVGSRAALGKVGRGIYAASKAGLVGFTRTWAIELAPFGITVNCVAPGPTATEMFRKGNPPDAPATKAIIDSIPLKRMGEPEEVAAAVEYFLQDDAGFTTGQVLYVDGGITVGLDPM